MIERVARALVANFNMSEFYDDGGISRIKKPWDELSPDAKAYALEQARAAIEAMREPTEEMLDAVSSFEDIANIDQDPSFYWPKMIDAALKE